mmetsp:Transcript_135610/g.433825  ORF Transcript_135610/g.433825 Transcript_135610/m.433825 type:complete len:291 (+) Transcript_135610:50-922(+)
MYSPRFADARALPRSRPRPGTVQSSTQGAHLSCPHPRDCSRTVAVVVQGDALVRCASLRLHVLCGVDAEAHHEAQHAHQEVPYPDQKVQAEHALRDGEGADEDVVEAASPQLRKDLRPVEHLHLILLDPRREPAQDLHVPEAVHVSLQQECHDAEQAQVRVQDIREGGGDGPGDVDELDKADDGCGHAAQKAQDGDACRPLLHVLVQLRDGHSRALLGHLVALLRLGVRRLLHVRLDRGVVHGGLGKVGAEARPACCRARAGGRALSAAREVDGHGCEACTGLRCCPRML